jgi:outer membrane protein OmpA-like peptidoglycan-associated protein
MAAQQDDGEEIVLGTNWMLPRLYLDDDYILRREWSFYLNGGLASMEYAASFGMKSGFLNNIAATYDYPSYIGIGGGLNYTRFVSRYVGITLGFEAISYGGYIESSSIQENVKFNIYALNVEDNHPYVDGIEVEGRNNFSRYIEQQSAWYVQFPLMIQLHGSPTVKPVRFFGVIGAKAGVAIHNKYDMKIGGNSSIYINEYAQTLPDVGHGTGAFLHSETDAMAMNFNVSASAELGARWRLGTPEFALYTSIYADYGLLNVLAPNSQPVQAIRTFGMDADNHNLFSTKYVDKVNLFSVGIKLRLAFGKMVMSADGEERTREMNKAYVRLAVRTSPENRPIPATLKGAVDNKKRLQIDTAIVALDDATFRIPMPKASDYTIAFNVNLPDNAKIDTAPFAVATSNANTNDYFGAAPKEKEKEKEPDPNLSTLKVILFNQKTGEPLPSRVVVFNIDNSTLDSANTAATDAVFSMQAKMGSFHRLVFNFNVPPTAANLFKKVKPGARIRMSNLFFKSGQSELSKDMKEKLHTLVVFMLTYNQVRVEISGHTDNKGNSKKNKQLSEKRAKVIADYLVEQGVASDRVVSVGHGDSRPIASNKTKKGQAKNRRIEIKIIK